MVDSSVPSKLSPEAAFSLLGNETRVAIVQALGETYGESLSFSTLRERIDASDSGQFNYHLKKLVGSFVARTDGGEYELTYAGGRVVGAILSGTYNRRGAPMSFELDSTCSVCGSSPVATYEDERVTIICPTCDDRLSTFTFPPGAFENRTHEELARAFDGFIRAYFSLAASGFCFNCAGRMSGSLTDDWEYLDDDRDVTVSFVYERCADTGTLSVGSRLVYHPDVIAFHHDHGVDLTETPSWELSWLRDEQNEILSREPWRVRLLVELGGDRLEPVVAEDLSVSFP